VTTALRNEQRRKEMKNRIKILLLILAVSNIQTFGQTKSCTTVYQTLDKNPNYDGGMNALMRYSEKYITPIISKYYKMDEQLLGKLTMTLTIGTDGKVIDVILSKHNFPKDCEEEIRKELLIMTGWTSGSLNGQKVCSKFSWVIGCIKWG
jgi:hypothetical protein